MTNEELMRRIGNGEDVTHLLDIQSAERREDFRSSMLKRAETDRVAQIALEHYDAAMRDLDSGVMGARDTWHSISPAQRRVLTGVERHGGRLDRIGKEYRATKGRHQPYMLAYVATIRPLCSRDLMAWDGGAFDPEAAAVITERGRFVLKHGPVA